MKSEKHGWRAAVFLAILLTHAVLLLLVIRGVRLVSLPKRTSDSLVIVMLARTQETATVGAAPSQLSRSRPPKHETPPDTAITIPPEVSPQPQIDWQHEAEVALQHNALNAEKDKNYRNLSGLSADQLKWIRENRMVPAPPGIEWTHPRFEFDSHSGLPVYWINDHCVLVMLMIFCGIGHIEPNGQLFKHMHDPTEN